MKNELNKTIDILQLLTNKISTLKQKSDMLLTEEMYNTLNDKINELSALFNNSSSNTPEPEEPTNNSFNYEITNAEHDVANGIYKPSDIIYNDSKIYIGFGLDSLNISCGLILWKQTSTQWAISVYGQASEFEQVANPLKTFNDQGTLDFYLTDVLN